MQRPRQARRAIVFHDDRLASEEELVKKKRLETSKNDVPTSHIPVPVEPLPDTICQTYVTGVSEGCLMFSCISAKPPEPRVYRLPFPP
jgi:hypothetical protein